MPGRPVQPGCPPVTWIPPLPPAQPVEPHLEWRWCCWWRSWDPDPNPDVDSVAPSLVRGCSLPAPRCVDSGAPSLVRGFSLPAPRCPHAPPQPGSLSLHLRGAVQRLLLPNLPAPSLKALLPFRCINSLPNREFGRIFCSWEATCQENMRR